MLKYIRLYITYCAVGLLLACGTKQEKVANSSADSVKVSPAKYYSEKHVDDFTAQSDYEVETYYIVIADTNMSYYSLRDEMFVLSQKVRNPIDTMGRFYNEAKNLIALPDDDEDEIYRGDYFPRRVPSNALSLEYLHFYNKTAKEKTIALVAGLYETEESADSTLVSVKKHSKTAFILKADVYVGCMH